MTAEEARAVEESAAVAVAAALQEAQSVLVQDIRDGMAPRDAVQKAFASFTGEFAATMAAGLSRVLSEAVGVDRAMGTVVGGVVLSRRLYAEADAVSDDVQRVVQRHVAGLQDSRRLALDLFEGYRFREPGAEPLQINRANPKLPKYMREALLTDNGVTNQLSRAYAQLQVDGLSTPALRAAYADVLRAIDAVEKGAADTLLSKRVEVAFFERTRYFATRIARTELHRAYAQREAELMMEDKAIEFIQIRRAPGRQNPCICALMTGRDLYGLGPGVYPKRAAPVPPFHPFCMCVQSPRLDLTGRKPNPLDEGGDAYFLRRLGQGVAGRIMGSEAKAGEVLAGKPALGVVNRGRDPAYHIKPIRV